MSNKNTRTQNHTLRYLMMITLCFITACASRSPISQLKQGESLSIEVAQKPQSPEPIRITNEAIGERSVQYGGGGALAGAAAGLTCGPWLFLCMPLGFAAGAVVGTTTGAIVGATEGLDEASEGVILEKLNKALDETHPNEGVEQELTGRAKRYFTLVDSENSNQLKVQLHNIKLLNHGDYGIALYMNFSVDLKFFNKDHEPQIKQDYFEYTSRPIQATNWMYAEEGFYQGILQTAYQVISEQIVINLVDRRSSESKKSDKKVSETD